MHEGGAGEGFVGAAVVVTMITGMIGLFTVSRVPGEYQRRLQLVPAIFRWFHIGSLWALIIWSIASLGLGLAGHISETLGVMPWLVFMISWWPVILSGYFRAKPSRSNP